MPPGSGIPCLSVKLYWLNDAQISGFFPLVISQLRVTAAAKAVRFPAKKYPNPSKRRRDRPPSQIEAWLGRMNP
jgi:hypothetical protein